ncbi:hypothetical protein [Flavobacterium sp. 40-81]|uniref:hypothetical protein n=1 Tax=Flavobacterium sp. 40-81 TaxID=1896169 RepID=UPI000967F5DD|nr:hypothetical protein [Flavobacterium sp. 40-81]OJV70998.1 MAG: hypothetical protein BGO42_04080 [Flavobacterium sp. 40-81]
MKKLLLHLIILGFYVFSYGQEQQPTAALDLKMPDYTPASPNAFAITKYGDIPINEFTGMVTANIPVYTYKAGKLEVPITLNYTGAGVKVNQTASWTGINWTLNAGGVITRTIHDKPDESEYLDGRITGDMILPGGMLNGSQYAAWLNMIFAKLRRVYDVKPDEYNFAFPGYSGNFFMDDNFIPRLVKADSNLKIEIVGTETDLKARLRQSKEFCITTPDGVKHYFGGENATETTFPGTTHDNPYSPTGFYLTRMEHPDYGTVYFDYETDPTSKHIRLDQGERVTIIEYELMEPNMECVRPPTDEGHSFFANGVIVSNGKHLSKIRSANNYIEVSFGASAGSPFNYTKVLNNIVVKNGTTQLQKVDLSYLFPQTPTTSERFFLTKVEFNKDKNYGSGGRKYEQYVMDYNDPLALPNSRMSQATDIYSYYNGKVSNTTALPQNNDILFHNYYPNLADRSSDFTYALKGSLKKITYPTGGYTEFEYESPKAKDYVKGAVNINIWRNSPGRIPATRTTASAPLGDLIFDPNGTGATSKAFIDEEIAVKIDVTANAQMGHTDRIVFKLIDETANTTESTNIIMPDGTIEIGTGNFAFTRTFTINTIKGHAYRVEMSNTYSSLIQYEATMYFNYTKGFKTVDEPGIRVIRTTDYTAATQSAFVKKYFYNKVSDLLKDPFELLNFPTKPQYTIDYQLIKCCNMSGGAPILQPKSSEIRFRSLSSQTTFPLRVLDKKYEYVTISYGGDNFELGGKQKHFNNQFMDYQVGIQPFSRSIFQYEKAMYNGNAEQIFSGTLLDEIDLIKRNGALYKVKEQNYKYQYDDIAYTTGVVGGYAFYNCLFINSGIDNFDLGKYYLNARRVELIEQNSKEFIEPVPMTIQGVNDDNYKSFVTKQEFIYNALIGLPTRTVTYTSEDNGVFWHNRIYANQPHLLTGITAEQTAAVSKLIELNKVAAPVEERTFKGVGAVLPTLTGAQRTLYKSWNNKPNLVLPEIIQASKGTAGVLEDRILIEEYDSQANPTLVSMKHGAKIKYAYNAFGQVIMKIENYLGATGGSESGGSFEIPETVPGAPCTLSQNYPGGTATFFYYDPETRLLIKKTDPNCRNTYYEYDALNRLKRIKDHDGNSIEEYDNNYKIN